MTAASSELGSDEPGHGGRLWLTFFAAVAALCLGLLIAVAGLTAFVSAAAVSPGTSPPSAVGGHGDDPAPALTTSPADLSFATTSSVPEPTMVVAAVAPTDLRFLGGNVPNAVPLGHYPAYIDLGAQSGARTFSMSDEAWNVMSPVEQGIARGREFQLATPLDQVRPGSFFEQELQYLVKQGYVPNAGGTAFIPGGP